MDDIPFPVEEGPLREWVLKAYQAQHGEGGSAQRVLDAIRQFLSGPPGEVDVRVTYRFEDYPDAAVASFVEDLAKARPDLPRAALEPLLSALEESREQSKAGFPANVPVWIASLAGYVSIRTGLDETLTSAILSAAVLGVSRLGPGPFRAALEGKAGQAPSPDTEIP